MNGMENAFLEYMNRIMDIALGKKEGTLAEQRLAEKLRQTVRVGLERELFHVMEEEVDRNIKQQRSMRSAMMRIIMVQITSGILGILLNIQLFLAQT
jgi:hypothetical protein